MEKLVPRCFLRSGFNIFLTLISVCYTADIGAETAVAQVKVAGSLDVDKVVSEFPVDFCLLTAGKGQYVAYYNQDRNMTVAARELGSGQWQYQTLPSKIDWNSHNYITMAVDEDWHLHVSGNMHKDKLVYFRTEKAGDISTLKRLPMTGKLEYRVIYPEFLNDHSGQLLFSGSGSMDFIGISVSSPEQVMPEMLTMSWRHRDYWRGRLVVNEQTLKPLKKEVKVPREIPKELDDLQSDFEGMQMRRSHDIGDSRNFAVRYLLQWETLGANHDRPRKPPFPQPSMLRLYKISSR